MAQAVLASVHPALIVLIPVALPGVAVLAAWSGRSLAAIDAMTEAEPGSMGSAEGPEAR